MCFFVGFAKYNYVRALVDSSISYYRPVSAVYDWTSLTQIVADGYNMALMVPLIVHM